MVKLGPPMTTCCGRVQWSRCEAFTVCMTVWALASHEIQHVSWLSLIQKPSYVINIGWKWCSPHSLFALLGERSPLRDKNLSKEAQQLPMLLAHFADQFAA